MIYLLFFLALIFSTTFIKTKARKVVLKNHKGHTVILQGTYHIADTPFYQSIYNDLNNYREQGFKILYERVVPQHPTKYKKILRLSKKRSHYLAKILNTNNQKNYISHYSDNDIRADIYFEDAKQHVQQLEASKSDVLDLFKFYSFIFKYKLSSLCRYFLNIMFFVHTLIEQIRKKENNNFIIGTRNKVVLNHINIDPTKNAYVHYGEGHITDLILKLQKQNYKVISCEYLKPFP